MDLVVPECVTPDPAPRLERDPHRLGAQRVTGPVFLAWVRAEMLLADAFCRRAAAEPDHARAEELRERGDL